MQGVKFNQDGITAILEDRKTMTRRPCKYQPSEEDIERAGLYPDMYNKNPNYWCFWTNDGKMHIGLERPKYKIGETVFVQSSPDEYFPSEMTKDESSTFLKITNIKVERLQNISEEDCIREGIERIPYDELYTVKGSKYKNIQTVFKLRIWEELPYQEPYDWNSNPYVFVYEFEVVK